MDDRQTDEADNIIRTPSKIIPPLQDDVTNGDNTGGKINDDQKNILRGAGSEEDKSNNDMTEDRSNDIISIIGTTNSESRIRASFDQNGFTEVVNEHSDKYSDDEVDPKDLEDISSSENDSESKDENSSGSSSDEESSEEEDDTPKMMDVLADEDEELISGPIVSKNEVVDEVAPPLPEGFQITENSPLELVGKITSVFENNVIIKANVSGEFRILDEGSVFCFKDRRLLGPLFETFGRLHSPFYRVIFNEESQAQSYKDKIGEEIFYVVPNSHFLYTDTIKCIKGTDASNCNDEELPEEEQDYSDDEQELAAKQAKKRKKNGGKNSNGSDENKRNQVGKVEQPNKGFQAYGYPAIPQKYETSQYSPQVNYSNFNFHDMNDQSSTVPSVGRNQTTYGPYGYQVQPQFSIPYQVPITTFHQSYFPSQPPQEVHKNVGGVSNVLNSNMNNAMQQPNEWGHPTAPTTSNQQVLNQQSQLLQLQQLVMNQMNNQNSSRDIQYQSPQNQR